MMLKSLFLAVAVTLTSFHATAQVKDCSNVTIHLRETYLPGAFLTYAKNRAGEMLATAGVRVQWTTAMPNDSGDGCGAPIVVRFAVGEQLASKPHAIAYTERSDDGINKITVFWNRVSAISARTLCSIPSVLAHVLAHEITHVLQSTIYHSDAGLMRESWTHAEYFEMLRGHLLPFTPIDIQLIKNGINYRSAHAVKPVLAVNPSGPNAQLPLDPSRPPR